MKIIWLFNLLQIYLAPVVWTALHTARKHELWLKRPTRTACQSRCACAQQILLSSLYVCVFALWLALFCFCWIVRNAFLLSLARAQLLLYCGRVLISVTWRWVLINFHCVPLWTSYSTAWYATARRSSHPTNQPACRPCHRRVNSNVVDAMLTLVVIALLFLLLVMLLWYWNRQTAAFALLPTFRFHLRDCATTAQWRINAPKQRVRVLICSRSLNSFNTHTHAQRSFASLHTLSFSLTLSVLTAYSFAWFLI